MKRLLALLCVAGLLELTGCGNFFTPQNSGGNGNGGNTAAGNVLYQVNAGSNSIAAYTVSTTGTLTAVSNSPYALGIVPTSAVITPGNTFLYIGSATGILGYSIGSGGALTALNRSQPVTTDQISPLSMKVDSTGGYLLAAGIDLSTTLPQIGVYQINATSGALTAVTGSPLAVKAGNGATTTNPPNLPNALYITPNNSYVYLTLGSGGTEVLTFNASGGALSDTGTYIKLATGGSGQVGAISNAASSLLFLTETGVGVRVFNIGSNGAPGTEITGSPFKTGTGPNGLTFDSTGDYLYVTNKGDATISGFSVAASGTVTALGSSPFTAGTLPLSITLDQSKKFIAVANSGGSPDLGVYSFDATTAGKLNLVSSEKAATPTGANLILSTH